jgi:hypothetical protein
MEILGEACEPGSEILSTSQSYRYLLRGWIMFGLPTSIYVIKEKGMPNDFISLGNVFIFFFPAQSEKKEGG